LLEQPENSKEIAEKIDFLFKHPEDRNRMAQQGFTKSQSITWEQTLNQTLSAYNHLIQPSKPVHSP